MLPGLSHQFLSCWVSNQNNKKWLCLHIQKVRKWLFFQLWVWGIFWEIWLKRSELASVKFFLSLEVYIRHWWRFSPWLRPKAGRQLSTAAQASRFWAGPLWDGGLVIDRTGSPLSELSPGPAHMWEVPSVLTKPFIKFQFRFLPLLMVCPNAQQMLKPIFLQKSLLFCWQKCTWQQQKRCGQFFVQFSPFLDEWCETKCSLKKQKILQKRPRQRDFRSRFFRALIYLEFVGVNGNSYNLTTHDE